MSALGQRVFFQHLSDPTSLATIVIEGVSEIVIPNEGLRPIFNFAVDYYFKSGRTKAPSDAVLLTEFGDLLADNEITLDEEPEESIEWAIDDLKAGYLHHAGVLFTKQFATELAESTASTEKIETVKRHATSLINLSLQIESHASRIDVREGIGMRLSAYEERKANIGVVTGMQFGRTLGAIDEYTSGIHPGELAILASPPKTGKSFFLNLVALREHEAGRVPCLFTLENSVEMTMDRIACLAKGIDHAAFAKGQATDKQIESVREWAADTMSNTSHPFWVLQPDIGERSFERMVREASVRGADSILIDQLSFVELTSDSRRPRHERIGDGMHVLKAMISTGRDRMPCLLAHQINREGVKAARATGYLEMEHLAEAAEVERTADWAFGLYRTRAEVVAGVSKFQTLASRRAELRHFMLKWKLSNDEGNCESGISVISEFTLEQS